ncbi:MAG: arsenic resistance N-acetyltransferase ArsN2 [Gemmatimonadota bacterium]
MLRVRMLRVTGVSMFEGLVLRAGSSADLEAISALLTSMELPIDGIEQWLPHFWVAESVQAIVGLAGVEVYGSSGLLRSVAVVPQWRGSGVARTLVTRILEEARSAGCKDIYLLTTTADRYFPRLGFHTIGRNEVPAELHASAELRGACPDTAVAMRRTLGADSAIG